VSAICRALATGHVFYRRQKEAVAVSTQRDRGGRAFGEAIATGLPSATRGVRPISTPKDLHFLDAVLFASWDRH